jgi:hypothetical protein
LAAEQRERQIEIMEAQLQHYEESGAVWEDVYSLLNDPSNFDDDGTFKDGSPLANLLKSYADYSGMSNLGKEDWW